MTAGLCKTGDETRRSSANHRRASLASILVGMDIGSRVARTDGPTGRRQLCRPSEGVARLSRGCHGSCASAERRGPEQALGRRATRNADPELLLDIGGRVPRHRYLPLRVAQWSIRSPTSVRGPCARLSQWRPNGPCHLAMLMYFIHSRTPAFPLLPRATAPVPLDRF